MRLFVFCNSIAMSLCVILLNITKREKSKQQHQIKFLNLQTFRNKVNSKLQKIGCAQQVTAKKGDKLKQKVPMQLIKCLRNQNKIPNKFK